MRADEIDENWEIMEQRKKRSRAFRLNSSRVKSRRGEACWLGEGMEYGLWPSLALLVGADDKIREMTGDGETFFWWSEQADQATPMRRAELRAGLGLGRVDDESGRRHLQEEDPLSAFQRSRVVVTPQSSLASLEVSRPQVEYLGRLGILWLCFERQPPWCHTMACSKQAAGNPKSCESRLIGAGGGKACGVEKSVARDGQTDEPADVEISDLTNPRQCSPVQCSPRPGRNPPAAKAQSRGRSRDGRDSRRDG